MDRGKRAANVVIFCWLSTIVGEGYWVSSRTLGHLDAANLRPFRTWPGQTPYSALSKTIHSSPISSFNRMLAAVRSAGQAGITSQQLALQLGIKDKDQRYLIFDAIDLLLDDGRIECGKKGRYTAAGGKDTTEGNIDIITSGAGYVRLGVVGDDDVYVQRTRCRHRHARGHGVDQTGRRSG